MATSRYHAHPHAARVDAAALAADLRRQVRGEVRFDPTTRAAYATDASNFRQPPIGVVLPHDSDDHEATIAVCRAHGAPVTNRGAGTSLSGETTNVAVVVDSSRYLDRVVSIDPEAGTAVVQAGVVLDDLQRAAAPFGLRFGPDPSTHSRCTVGGMVGNNSCGPHSLTAGRTSDNVVSLDVLRYDGTRLTARSSYDEAARPTGAEGEVVRSLRALRDTYGDDVRRGFPVLPRRVSGFNLDALLPERGCNVAASLVGTEGTCVTVLSAELRLRPVAAASALAVLGFDDIVDAAEAVPEVLAHGPDALEAMDRTLATVYSEGQGARLLGGTHDYLVAELTGSTPDEARARAARLAAAFAGGAVIDDPEHMRLVWWLRESALGAAAVPPGGPLMWPGWEDAAVAPDRLAGYLRDLRALYAEHGFRGAAIYGHFGEGCVHSRIPFDLVTERGVQTYRDFLAEAAALVVSHGGSLSGEHGDGQQRAALLSTMFGPGLVEAFRAFKAVWDPTGHMNPGKVVDPVRLFDVDENLRLGPAYRPGRPRTEFALAEDDGSFARATLRCVGMGKCRDLGGQTMCPSYMVTRDEVHSTRGRARVLFEMLDGSVVTDGWRSREVLDALDLCLSCKGCKRDCPVSVDMATYKAEFLFHHYRHRVRPRQAYAFGLVMYAARLGALAPGLANALLHGRRTGRLAKRLAGVHPDRVPPRLAARTLRAWASRRPPGDPARPAVVLFPDTFTDHFDVEVGQAAHRVLTDAGFRVTLPSGRVCCGRPLIDQGMLRHARRVLRGTLRRLEPLLADGAPVVVPEPSCAAVFRDELVGLLPDDAGARRLAARTRTLAEVLEDVPGWQPPPLPSPVLVQRHCHHSAVLGTDPDRRLLLRTGADVDIPDTGCCGLAGGWGYERAHHDLSMACGERVLFPLVREATPATTVIADGFSCRQQISAGTGRRALHLAQLLDPDRRSQTHE